MFGSLEFFSFRISVRELGKGFVRIVDDGKELAIDKELLVKILHKPSLYNHRVEINAS